MKIFVVIATYNEKENISRLVNEILQLNIVGLEVLVVDDNSPDGTAAAVRSVNHPAVHLVVRQNQRGYGSAHIAGFQFALDHRADIVVSMDADFSHPPAVIPALIKTIEAGNEVAVGSRRVAGGTIVGWGWGRKLASRSAMVLARLILGLKTRDVTTGFRAYRATALRRLKLETIRSNGYSFLEELIYRCEQQKLKIKEIPIVFIDREHGKSKFSIIEIIRFFITLIKLRFTFK
jgi:dolichol-phosphate mannosyltransferase